MIRDLECQRLIFVQNVFRLESFFKVEHLRGPDVRLYCLAVQNNVIIRSVCVFSRRIRVEIDQEFALEGAFFGLFCGKETDLGVLVELQRFRVFNIMQIRVHVARDDAVLHLGVAVARHFEHQLQVVDFFFCGHVLNVDFRIENLKKACRLTLTRILFFAHARA